MIKFYRKIRQKLLSQNRFSKYLIYAVGEIVLVVIGILIALSINNWNTKKQNQKNSLSFLHNLKEEVISHVTFTKYLDSLTATYISSFEEPFANFHKIRTVNDLMEIQQHFNSQWNNLRLTMTTYEEMVNTGSMYTLENKLLQKHISNYYAFVKSMQYVIQEMNKTTSELLFLNNEMFRASYLDKNYKKEWFQTQHVDTSWINDPNSTTYLTKYRFLDFSLETDKDKRNIYQGVIGRGSELLTKIQEELNKT